MRGLWWSAASLVLCGCGLTLIFSGPFILRQIIGSVLRLRPNSTVFEKWQKTPFLLPLDFYFFNWTNPQEIYNESVKPKFEEVGPYRYWEDFRRSDVIWNDNGTISYRQQKFWYFDESSNLQDRINIINPVTLGAAHIVRSAGYFVRKALSLTLSSRVRSISINLSIDELLFKGVTDPLLDVINAMPFLGNNAMDKFGLYYKRNGSELLSGVFNMDTGGNSRLGHLYNWNYKNRTDFYEGSCGNVQASTGAFFHNVHKPYIYMFAAELCQIIRFQFVAETKVHGLLGHKYAVGDYMLDNGTLYPENKCFCGGECVPSGVFNISSCSQNSPIFISMPHFDKADPYYNSLIEGLRPNTSKHEFFMTVEPTTGIPLEVNGRFQMNMLLQPVPGIWLYENVPKVFLPIMWCQHKFKMKPSDAFSLKLMLHIPLISASIGGFLLFIGLAVLPCIVYRNCIKRKHAHLKENHFFKEQSIPLQKK